MADDEDVMSGYLLLYVLLGCVCIIVGGMIFAYFGYMTRYCGRRFSKWNRNKTNEKTKSFCHSKYGVNADKQNERRNIFSHFKLPGNAAENLSNTYEEYGVNHSYAVYKLDDSYEEYIEK